MEVGRELDGVGPFHKLPIIGGCGPSELPLYFRQVECLLFCFGNVMVDSGSVPFLWSECTPN